MRSILLKAGQACNWSVWFISCVWFNEGLAGSHRYKHEAMGSSPPPFPFDELRASPPPSRGRIKEGGAVREKDEESATR
jgi:hypothetical protein